MKIIYTNCAAEDRAYWQNNRPKLAQRIDLLIADIQKHPFAGLGKPEPLRFEKLGYWSRRINQEHRLVYKIHDHTLYIAQCRYHY